MNTDVKKKFDNYPEEALNHLHQIRSTILKLNNKNGIGEIEETLKWGEPAYCSANGSTVRIDWKSKYPDQCFVYFHCKTRLIDTFREIYGDLFNYEGNRAIVLKLDEDIPLEALEHCISLSLRYHKIKHLPLLGE